MAHRKACLILFWMTMLASASAQKQDCPINGQIKRMWRNPPSGYQMKTWWFFGYEQTTDEGITADAEALKDAGFGGVVYYDQQHAADASAQGAEDAFSPEWWHHLRFAAAEARRCGLTFELNLSNGYCAGGRWIDAAHAMQRVAAAVTTVEKGGDGQWKTNGGDLAIQGRDGYVKDIAIIAMPCGDDAMMRHITASYNAQGKGRNGAMQGPLETAHGEFSGYGFTPLPDIGSLQVSDDSISWHDVVTLKPMYRSQGGYFVRTNSFPATSGRFWRINYTGEARLKDWHIGSEAMLDRWEELTALQSDFAEVDATPPYGRQETIDPKACIVCLSPTEAQVGNPLSILPANSDCDKWRILRLASVITGAKSKHGRQNLAGYECDKLSEEAANLHWDSYVQVLLDSLPVGSVAGVTMDSHEGGSQNWTPLMLEEFRLHQGYDLTPYLPALAGYVVESPEKTAQVLYDYRQTIAALIQEKYYGTFQRRATSQGLTFTAQAIGNALCITGDAISVKQVVDKPQGEFWTYQQQGAYDVKDCSSAAHLYGKPIASAEAMTDCEYKDTPMRLHRVANIAFSMGAQEFVVCATPHIPQPHVSQPYTAGREYAINRSNPLWRQMMPVWQQAARSMVMLRQGKAAPDVLVFLGDDAPIKTLASRLPDGIGHLDWDVCTGDALKNRLIASNGQISTPDGVTYHALLIADKAHVNNSSRKMIDSLREAGVAILHSGENITRPLLLTKGAMSVVHTHRKTTREDIFYLANIEESITHVAFRLQANPNKIQVWHNMTGRRQWLKPDSGGTFSLSLQPCESVFLIYKR